MTCGHRVLIAPGDGAPGRPDRAGQVRDVGLVGAKEAWACFMPEEVATPAYFGTNRALVISGRGWRNLSPGGGHVGWRVDGLAGFVPMAWIGKRA